ncbi:A-deaminase domain-containing protein [Aphelenchoides fujianensis]|nr:A-deaminase domain-containing protein [Aphelenchoides fujianensis]
MGQLTTSLFGSTGDGEAKASKISGSRFPFPKIQLHCHLDGCLRFQTILELANSKKIDLRGAKTVEDVKKLLVTTKPSSLAEVLAAFDIFLPVVIGDLVAIERIAYEMCEDMARDGARSILCCIRAHDVWNQGIVELALKHKDHGVVAIDAAGCSHGSDEKYEPSVVAAFLRAQELGIHRTVHAGESAGAQSVVRGVEEMKVERIGHGYHLTDNEAAYQKYAKDMRIHLEACPLSSMMTGAVDEDWTRHPVVKWAHDGVNFSLSTDDPTCFDNSTESELSLAVDKIGLSVLQLWQCQLNAAHSCFLPDNEKAALVERIRAAQPKAV